jgi:hypothetical protein
MKPRVEKTGFQAVTPKVAAAFRHKLEERNSSPRIARISRMESERDAMLGLCRLLSLNP